MMILTLAACLAIHLPGEIPYRHTITTISCRNHVDPRLVAAIIETESHFRRYARRVERDGHVSLGLMQVKVKTARWLGFKKPARTLYLPWVNLFYGVRYLAMNISRYRDVWDGVSAYNAGRPLRTRGRIGYGNGRYVHAVWRNYSRILGQKPGAANLYRALARRALILTSTGRLYLRSLSR